MAISLNDHENRIKDVEVKLPDIENKLNDITQSGYYEIKSYSMRGYGSITVDTKYTNWDYQVCGWDGAIAGDGYDYHKGQGNMQFSKSRIRISTYETQASSGARPVIAISKSGNVMKISQGSGYPIKGSYTVTFIFLKPTANNLYYKLLDRVSSLFSEVISCLSA